MADIGDRLDFYMFHAVQLKILLVHVISPPPLCFFVSGIS